jgi:hypothetical protein
MQDKKTVFGVILIESMTTRDVNFKMTIDDTCSK